MREKRKGKTGNRCPYKNYALEKLDIERPKSRIYVQKLVGLDIKGEKQGIYVQKKSEIGHGTAKINKLCPNQRRTEKKLDIECLKSGIYVQKLAGLDIKVVKQGIYVQTSGAPRKIWT